MQTKQKIIIDTDPGHDDALAIMLMHGCEHIEILAITTVAGNSDIQNTTNNARYVLDLISSDVQLHSGSEKPLSRPLVKADVHGKSGLDGAEVLKKEPLLGDAVERIVELISTYPNEITIVMLGPCTNLAKAFLQDAKLPLLVKEVVIMGGAINVPGNKSRTSEFNIFVDPEAADIIFNSKVKKTLVPLDACNDIYLSLENFDELKEHILYGPVLGMMMPYIKGIQKFEKTSGALMYDPLAAYYIVNPSAFVVDDMNIQVETRGEHTLGMTVADRRRCADITPNISVATKIDGEKFKKDFFTLLRKL